MQHDLKGLAIQACPLPAERKANQSLNLSSSVAISKEASPTTASQSKTRKGKKKSEVGVYNTINFVFAYQILSNANRKMLRVKRRHELL